jgi:hypothetical protein
LATLLSEQDVTLFKRQAQERKANGGKLFSGKLKPCEKHNSNAPKNMVMEKKRENSLS